MKRQSEYTRTVKQHYEQLTELTRRYFDERHIRHLQIVCPISTISCLHIALSSSLIASFGSRVIATLL